MTVMLVLLLLAASAFALVDDRAITLNTPADVAARRAALIQYIWGPAGFPASKLPSSVQKNVASPVSNLTNLSRVDTLGITMDAGETGLAHHFIPQRTNRRLVVLHHGHACTFNDATGRDYGMRKTIDALLVDGYSVLAVYMPHMKPGDCGTPSHTQMFATISTTGSVMTFFLEPVAVSLNYLKTRAAADNFPVYQDYNMVGLSGGGWTTTVYAAIDPTIRISIPVAGTTPLYLRSGSSVGDTEQFQDAFYTIAGYPDLYVLGSHGFLRKQVQLLNRLDDCCFGQAQHAPSPLGMPYDVALRDYEIKVRLALANLGQGFFRIEIDEAAPDHRISPNGIANVILAELNHGRRPFGAAGPSDAFVRGDNGHLWHWSAAGWQDLGFAAAGVPTVLQGAVGQFDVFYRDPANRLMRAWRTAVGWSTAPMNGLIITDPTAASWGPGRFDVVALGGDYKLYHWWWDGTSVQRELMHATAQGQGPAAVVASASRLDVLFRGWDRGLYHLGSSGSAPWALTPVGGIMLDFPAAVMTPGPTLRAYVRGQSTQLWEARQSGGAWQWASVSAAAGSTGTLHRGSPSASVAGGTVSVHMAASGGNLATFRLGASWTFTNNAAGIITGSPVSVSGVAQARGQSGGLWLFDGLNWTLRGGRFD